MKLILFAALHLALACGGSVAPCDPPPDGDAPDAASDVVDAALDVTPDVHEVGCVIGDASVACTGNNWVIHPPCDAGFGCIDAGIVCDQTACRPGWSCDLADGGALGVCE